MNKKIKVQVSASAMLFLAALLLLLPLKWVGAAILAAIVHEACHILAICLLGRSIQGMSIGGRGIELQVGPMGGVREIICALAGPIGSFMLLALAPRFPRTAICGLIHGIYNLIPMFPMDGGRVLRCFLYGMISPPLASKIYLFIQRSIAVCIVLGCGVLTLRLGILPMVFGLLILRNHLKENPLAKNLIWQYNRGNLDEEVRL